MIREEPPRAFQAPNGVSDEGSEGYCPQYTTGRGWSDGYGNKDPVKNDRETSCSIAREVKRDGACSKPRATTGRHGDSPVFDTGE